jgi:hypothetical protein
MPQRYHIHEPVHLLYNIEHIYLKIVTSSDSCACRVKLCWYTCSSCSALSHTLLVAAVTLSNCGSNGLTQRDSSSASLPILLSLACTSSVSVIIEWCKANKHLRA